MIDLLVVACGVVRIKLLFLQRRVSLGFLRAMAWWGGSNLVSTSPDTNGEKPRVKIDTLIENALAKHDNTHRAPKQWAFQRHKLNSFENWRQNLIYSLSLDRSFSLYLSHDARWAKKSQKNKPQLLGRRGFDPLRQTVDCLTKVYYVRPHARSDCQLLSRYFTQCYSIAICQHNYESQTKKTQCPLKTRSEMVKLWRG